MLVLKDHARIRVFVQGLDLPIDVNVDIPIMEGIACVRIILLCSSCFKSSLITICVYIHQAIYICALRDSFLKIFNFESFF